MGLPLAYIVAKLSRIMRVCWILIPGNLAVLDGEGQALKEREIHMTLNHCAWYAGNIGDGEEVLAHRWQMIEPFFEPETCQVVGAKLISEVGRELLTNACHRTGQPSSHPASVAPVLNANG
jgi:hypothetical protein